MNAKRQKIILVAVLVLLVAVIAQRRDWRSDRWGHSDQDRTERREKRRNDRDQRETAAEDRSKSARKRDLAAKERESAAQQRDPAAQERGPAAQERDPPAGERGRSGDERNNDREGKLKEREDAQQDRDRDRWNSGANHGFDRNIDKIVYSKHARCRMDCRHIDESEIKQIRDEGKINLAKSELDNSRDPKYALEGITHDKQRVRIIFAQQPAALVVVTCIDLEKEWSCNCN